MIKLFFLVVILTLSTTWMYLLHYFAPDFNESNENVGQVSFPSSLNELRNVVSTLKTYSVNHWWYVLLMFSSAYIYKQAFCIPGSIFLNMLAGALYGNLGGLLFACIFTATGASLCYLISNLFAKDMFIRYFPQKFKNFQTKVNQNKDHLLYLMMFLRLISVAPGWLINITAPIAGIPLKTFYISTLIGLVPYNFVGVSAGQMLSSIRSVNDVFSWKVMMNLSLMGIAILGPAFILKSRRETEKIKNS